MVVLGYGGGRDAFFFFLCNKHHDGQQHIDGYKIWGASESFLGVGREEEEGGDYLMTKACLFQCLATISRTDGRPWCPLRLWCFMVSTDGGSVDVEGRGGDD